MASSGARLQTEFFRRDFVAAHCAVANFGNFGWSGDGDLVEPVAAVNNQRATQAEFAEGLGEFLDQVRGVDSDNLRRSVRGIG